MFSQEWNIQSRALSCAVTGQPFAKGECIYSALYWRNGQYQRVDLCAEAWAARNDNIEPLSAWQTDFVPPTPPEPEALRKDDAESLLRRLVAESSPGTRNARYILALMLERKKMLRQVDKQKQGDDAVLVYEHLPSGEVWLIEDPGLKLGQLTNVQDEVARLLEPTEPVKAPPPVAGPVDKSSDRESEPSPASS